jgi:HAD superfamily, subfamily IIIB (Acid phosphatase)
MQDNSRSVAEFKSSARRRIADQGYRIILNVGDQLSDLSGEPASELSVKLPNPLYFILMETGDTPRAERKNVLPRRGAG